MSLLFLLFRLFVVACLLSTVQILLLARPPAAFVAASLAVAREKVLEKIPRTVPYDSLRTEYNTVTLY